MLLVALDCKMFCHDSVAGLQWRQQQMSAALPWVTVTASVILLLDSLTVWSLLLMQGWEGQRKVDIRRWVYCINCWSTGKGSGTDHTEVALPATYHFHTKVCHSSTHSAKLAGGHCTLHYFILYCATELSKKLSIVRFFLKFLHWHSQQWICNKVVLNDSTSPQMRCYTTLWL